MSTTNKWEVTFEGPNANRMVCTSGNLTVVKDNSTGKVNIYHREPNGDSGMLYRGWPRGIKLNKDGSVTYGRPESLRGVRIDQNGERHFLHEWPPGSDSGGWLNPARSGAIAAALGLFAGAGTGQEELTRRDPLIPDIDGDGLETTSVANGTFFDHNADGFAENIGWVGPDDGLLVRDRNGNGTIDDGTELFGDQTPLKNGSTASNGFEALAELDDNLDGVIDVNDLAYDDLRVWQDTNADGVSTADELHTLDSLGIDSVSTSSTPRNETDPQGNVLTDVGNFTREDASTGEVGNYDLQSSPTFTIPNEWLPVSDEISALPHARGYRVVHDLDQTMVRDSSGHLQSLVEELSTTTDVAERQAIMEQILFAWSGCEAIDPAARGDNIDARKLAFLEKFLGEAFIGENGPNPTYESSVLLAESYRIIFEHTYAELLAQTHLEDLYTSFTVEYNPETQRVEYDGSAATAILEQEIAANPDQGKARLSEESDRQK
ncbi:hypothetical protein ACFL2Q_17330, partial [Thermodesulfobacteriota bacterium]